MVDNAVIAGTVRPIDLQPETYTLQLNGGTEAVVTAAEPRPLDIILEAHTISVGPSTETVVNIGAPRKVVSLVQYGTPGADGADGIDGDIVELQVTGDMLQWRYVGQVAWNDLVDLTTVVPGTMWGLVGGVLSNQTDLQAALDAKLDDSQAGAFGLTLLGTAAVADARTALAYTTSLVPEGSNLYFTDARAIAAPITGYAVAGSRTALAASDTVLGAFNKLGKWVNDLVAIAFTGAAADLSGTKTSLFISDFAAAADARITAQKGVASGLATLDGSAKIPTSQLPALAITNTSVVNSQVAMLALTAETGDVAVRTDLNKSFILAGASASTLADWQELLTPTDAVLSVNGQTGAVSLSTTNISEGSNLYFTEPRVLSTVLTGFAAAGARTAIAAADSILTAFGKAQKYFNDLSALAFSGSAADLSGTKTSLFISDFSTAADARIVAANKQGNIQFQDEGVNQGAAGAITTINFTGGGVAAAAAGNTLTVAVSGGGGGGSVSIETVEVDFTTPARERFFDAVFVGASIGQKVIAMPSLSMPAGVQEDELEADPIIVSGHVVASNQVRLLVASARGDLIYGKRNINFMIV